MTTLEDWMRRAVDLEARLRIESKNALAVQLRFEESVYSDLDEKERTNKKVSAEVVRCRVPTREERRWVPPREGHRWIGGGDNATEAVLDLCARLQDGLRGRIEHDQAALADAGGGE